jgi:hypothetical protein
VARGERKEARLERIEMEDRCERHFECQMQQQSDMMQKMMMMMMGGARGKNKNMEMVMEIWVKKGNKSVVFGVD